MSGLTAFASAGTLRHLEHQDAGLVALPSASAGAGGRSVAADPYAWERAYERPWESIQEDESGLLKIDAQTARRAGQRREVALARVQRGMLRNVFLVLDMSRAMEVSDSAFKPSRSSSMAAALKDFVREFFDTNPISALGVVVCRDGVAQQVTELGSNPRKHVQAVVDQCEKRGPSGDWSLRNGLDVARRLLSMVPTYATREIVVVHAALATVDSGNIFELLAQLKPTPASSSGPSTGQGQGQGQVSHPGHPGCRVSVVSMGGEVYIATRAAAETGGTSYVPTSHEQLRVALLEHCRPPPKLSAPAPRPGVDPTGYHAESQMMQMGFPALVFEEPGLCSCHKMLRPKAYVCPQCAARCCEIPTRCLVCGLQLVSAPSLARSYHHLFPVPVFVEVPNAHEPGSLSGGTGTRTGREGMMENGEGAQVGGGGVSVGAASGATGIKRRRVESDTEDSAMHVEQGGGAGMQWVHNSDVMCSGCMRPLAEDEARYVCVGSSGCGLAFCSECDSFIHETLHVCPGCASG